MPKVSVIIPAWGEVPFLERARESLLSQTYRNIEILVVAPKKDEPQTAVSARHAGIEAAKGEWIAFCDADDWIESEAIEKMVAAAEREDADCVCCGMVRDNIDGKSVLRPYDKTGPNDTYNALVNKLFRRELLLDIRIDKHVTLGQDLMVSAQVLAKARKIIVLDDLFYHYCENMASVTHVQNGRRRVENLARVGEILRETMPGPEFADFHDRVTRDALLVWIRYRLFDRELWRHLRSRMTGGLLADPRHGILKKGALACASFLFD